MQDLLCPVTQATFLRRDDTGFGAGVLAWQVTAGKTSIALSIVTVFIIFTLASRDGVKVQGCNGANAARALSRGGQGVTHISVRREFSAWTVALLSERRASCQSNTCNARTTATVSAFAPSTFLLVIIRCAKPSTSSL